MLPKTCDFLVAGGGIVGVHVAHALQRQFPAASVLVLDKERAHSMHASGRNSGVMHAGFYYTSESLKAKFCRQGNEYLREFCEDNGIVVNPCGKLVVAQSPELIDQVEVLRKRGLANGVVVEVVNEAEARELEPLARTHEKALWSPNTWTADPRAVMTASIRHARDSGVEFGWGYACEELRESRHGITVSTSGVDYTTVEARHFVNCAGLYADKLAHQLGVGTRYTMVPFKGIYLELDPKRVPLRRHVYPVPDLRNPFLGVHLTLGPRGKAKVGPTAIPALWRENYEGTDNFDASELMETLRNEASLFVSNTAGFRQLALEEVKKYYRPYLLRSASALLQRPLEMADVTQFGRPGIRAQLMDIKEKRLEMDFIVEPGPSSTHVLNAVSPGWTSARPFSEYVAEIVSEALE